MYSWMAVSRSFTLRNTPRRIRLLVSSANPGEYEESRGYRRAKIRRHPGDRRAVTNVHIQKATGLQAKFVEFYEAGRIACALCPGTSLLRYAKLKNGDYLVKGKTVTGFANVEENFADNAVWSMNLLPRDNHVTPWRIEDELKK
jgi:putative intracellular protease/amidase